MFDFVVLAAIVGLGMLIWDCVEVGRNDAANLVNAVFGARVLKRRVAVIIAGIAVILGATFSSGVMETARKGIFDPTVDDPDGTGHLHQRLFRRHRSPLRLFWVRHAGQYHGLPGL